MAVVFDGEKATVINGDDILSVSNPAGVVEVVSKTA
jgi:hypothetical protein